LNEQELFSLLKTAADCLNSNDRDGFMAAMRRADQFGECSEALMGERLILATLGGLTKREELLTTLERAEKMTGGSSRLLAPHTRFVENHYDAFRLWGKIPGHADMMRELGVDFDRLSGVIQRLTGIGAGIKESYLAQLAFYRGDFDEALRWANAEIPAGKDGQTDLLRAYRLEILAGIAKHTRNLPLWRRSYGELKKIAAGEQPAGRSCKEQTEVICAMLEMSLGCLHDAPAWVKTGDFGVVPAPHGYEIIDDRLLSGTLPSAMIAHIEYLTFSGEYVRALQVAALVLQVLGIRNVITDAYVSLLRANCYVHLNRPEYARRAVEEAMDYIVPDGLWLIAAEFVPAFGELVCAVAGERAPDAPEKILHIGRDLWDKITPLRSEMLRGASEGLTKREQEVMNLVMKGHSNAEIAEQLKISVRTVRFHLENVYSKLNISRRSKFVSEIEQSGTYKLANWVKKP